MVQTPQSNLPPGEARGRGPRGARREWRRTALDNLLAVLALAVVVVLWDALVRWRGYPAFVLPGPWRVAQRFIGAWRDGSLLLHIGVTLREVWLGLALGLSVALALGYVLAKSRSLERVFFLFIVASQAIPIVALAPLLVIWFGTGSLSKVLVCALTVFFPVLVNTVVGIRSIDPDLVDLMRSLQATRWETFRLLELPSALPILFGGLKIGVTLSVIGAVVGEFVGSDRGLGFLVNLARGLFDTPLMFVALLTLMVIALAMYGLVSWLEARVLSWRIPEE